VLLRNEGNALPLKPGKQRIALIGPLGDAPLEMFGCWFAAAGLESASILEGLRTALPQADIRHVPGVAADGGDASGIADAVAAAHEADTVILSLGETKDMTGEAHSRGRIDLPGHQRALAEAVLALGKPTIAILTHGRPLALPWLFERADAVLATWQLGSQAGYAIADVLTGAWNPSGRLAITWPYDGGQIPIFHSHRATGRPGQNDVFYSNRHTDMPVEPQFPFGFGLSYTRFVVSAVTATPVEFGPGETVTVQAELTNAGSVVGEETAFLFLRDPVASIARPVLELKRFAKVTLAPGENQTVRFTLRADDFAFLDKDLRPRNEPGAFEILVGPCADRSKLRAATINHRKQPSS
jgi:beta-glucosidase